jgi:zinc/manganese transport system ATP-binding protein
MSLPSAARAETPVAPLAPGARAESDPLDPAPARAGAPSVELRDATASVGGRTVWSGVNLTVDPGEFVAVIGPNGAGKSTLVKVLLGLLPLAGGEARILGRPPGEASDRIGYLPQRRSFDPGLRVRGVDVVRLGLDGDRWGVPLPGLGRIGRRRQDDDRRVDEVLHLVGATSYAQRPVGQVSGGEQQRLLIAQALVRRPALMLLDEPLDSLDLPNQAAVAALISGICRDRGVTVILVAHDVNPILSSLDRVVYLAGGRAVAGTPQEVIRSDTLSRLYGTPIEVLTTSDGQLVIVGHTEAPADRSERLGHRG